MLNIHLHFRQNLVKKKKKKNLSVFVKTASMLCILCVFQFFLVVCVSLFASSLLMLSICLYCSLLFNILTYGTRSQSPSLLQLH